MTLPPLSPLELFKKRMVLQNMSCFKINILESDR